LVMRPRPVDQLLPGETWTPGVGPSSGRTNFFPPPADPNGDVKNLVGSPGGNDSIWLDLGYPVNRTPAGRRYKPLFAFFIVDLDNRVNVNVTGNIKAGGNHASNQGLGKWEVSLAQVMTQGGGTEWRNLFLGSTTPSIKGRYGPDGVPASGG